MIAIVTYLDAVFAVAAVVEAVVVGAAEAAAGFAAIIVVGFAEARAVAAVEEGRPRADVSIDCECHSRSVAAAEAVVEPGRRLVFAVAVAAGTEHC